MEKTIAVKEIATFLYSSGDLTNEFFSNHSLTEGKKAHQFLQKKYNNNSEKEYYIKYTFNYLEDKITIHGFIDGVLNIDGKIILEEIKSTSESLDKIDLDYHHEYLAQLKLYAYLYAKLNDLNTVNIRLTYIDIPDYKTKSFDLTESFSSLEDFFNESIKNYINWFKVLEDANNEKIDSIRDIKFPFSIKRKGQQELMKACYMTLSSNAILYAIAPTGIGKTMATLFSALKSINNAKEKLFYLTAKNMGKKVAVDSIKLLNSKGLKLHSIVISSKAKCCMMRKEHCDPEKCPYAKGYFSRLRDAIKDIYENENIYTYEVINEYAYKHQICSFEYSLDLSYFCDLVICDYNYVFDPKAHLIRYFDDSEYEPKILCDEAHNLVERAKDMYSATIDSYLPYEVDSLVSSYDKKITKITKRFLDEINKYNDLVNKDLFYYSHFLDDNIYSYLRQLYEHLDTILTDNKDINNKEEILNKYFDLKDFLDICNYFSQDHLFIVNKIEENHFEIQIKCCDASSFIYDTVKNKTKGIVFFSATLFPINYYMDLLTKGNGKYIILKSPFDSNKLKLIIKDDISTKYKDRENTINDVCNVIKTLINCKKGNYIVFFPSYKYILLLKSKLDLPNTNIIVQQPNMTDEQRNEILEEFKDTSKSHLGLFVMGGSFSEGVDFVGDLLNGVIVVGVGLPMINNTNNLLKEFFEEKYGMGFDYAYTYPGFNKVIQAAGRVIRTEEDYGVVILLDQRYKTNLYQSLMPDNFNHRMVINDISKLEDEIVNFYDEYDNKKIL